jgi:alpha-ketoglutarate-dependent taurine dioxygenase
MSMSGLDRQGGYRTLELRPMTGVLGAEIYCLDLRAVSGDAVEEVRRAVAENLVITFPGQVLSHDEHTEFTRRLSDHIQMPQVKSLGNYEDQYRCWQTRTPYDESAYLNALKKLGSPLLIQLAQKTYGHAEFRAHISQGLPTQLPVGFLARPQGLSIGHSGLT